MKKLLITFCLTVLAIGVFAQGTVKFANSSSTLVSWGYGGSQQPIPGNATMLFYFALLTAPSGTTDWTAFTFGNAYATNTAAAGRIQGGSLLGVTVSGWAPTSVRAFEILGWTAPGWVAFSPAWLTGGCDALAASGITIFGRSMIAEGSAGGPDPATGLTIPSLALFSATTINGGFDFGFCPEPNTAALAGLGAAALLIFRRRK